MAVKTIVAVIVFILLTITATAVFVDSFGYLESIDTCNNCHFMQPYVESLIRPINGSVILDHININTTCVDCHGGTTYKHRLDAQLTIAKKIISYELISNISGVDLTPLDVNCIDCHPAIVDSLPHKGNTSCNDCHLAHRNTLLPQDFNDLECSKCHMLPERVGKHAQMDCRACHIRHKYKPKCTQCHPPHAKTSTSTKDLAAMASDWTNDICLGCHNDSHSPNKELVFTLSANMSKELCAGCHSESEVLELYGSFHNNLISCALCHISHGKIDVRDCNTAYCHGGIDLNWVNNFKTDIEREYPESLCNNCHKSGPKKLHFNALEHGICTDCHGIGHSKAHVSKYKCDYCHRHYKKCRDCHSANIHKLKA